MNKTKRFEHCDILFVLSSLSIGGVEKTNISLANHFSKYYKKKISIVVLTNKNSQLKNFISKDIDLIVFDREHIYQSFFNFLRLIRNIRPKIIFSAMNYVNIFTIISTKISLIKTKIIISERNDQVEKQNALEGYKEKIYHFAFRFIISRIYSHANLIHCISEGVKNSLYKAYNVKKKNIKVIYNPINLSLKKKIKLKKKKENRRKINFLSVGRLVKQKNHEILIKALAILKNKINFHLFIIGEGAELYNLKNLSKKLKLTKNITFTGKLNDPSTYYEEADIFILSSIYEGFGNVIVEALAFNCKVISSDCPSGPREILENGKWGRLFPVNDHICLANSIIDVYKNNLYQNSNIRANDFSIKKIGYEYNKMFNKILHKAVK